MDPSILSLPNGKIVGQTVFFSFGKATGIEVQLWIQTNGGVLVV